MRIAIHNNEGSFASKWIEYCEENDIHFGIVNCYDSDIVETMRGYDILLWHHQQSNPKDYFLAKKLFS